MSREYQEFRRRTLEELKTEQPEWSYQQKLRAVSEKWNQMKITQMTTMTPEEIIDNLPRLETVYRKLKHTVDSMTESVFMKLETNTGENLLLTILEYLFRTNNDKFVQNILRKFVTVNGFYQLTFRNGLDVVDLAVYHQRKDLIHLLLINASDNYLYETIYHPKKRSRASCIFGLLFLNLSDKDMKPWVMEFTRQSMRNGLDPNLEIGDVICGYSVKDCYKTEDEVFRFLIDNSIDPMMFRGVVNYSGLGDAGAEYRAFINFSFKDSPEKVNLDGLDYVGETIFSVYLSNSDSQRHRSFCETLINMNVIDMKTIVVKNNKPTSYQSIIFNSDSLKLVINVGFTALNNTPTYFLYVPSAGNPLQRLIDSFQTPWEIFILSRCTIWDGFRGLFRRFLVYPTEDLMKRLIVNTEFREEIVKLYEEESQGGIAKTILIDKPSVFDEPLKTCLAKLVLTPEGLQKIVTELRAGNLDGWQEGFTREFLNFLVERTLKEKLIENVPRENLKNEWFMYSGESTLEAKQPLLFRSEDDYLFEFEELGYLMTKHENPYNRRPLCEKEIKEVTRLTELFSDWWFLLPRLPNVGGQTSSSTSSVKETLVGLIDSMIDQSPFFLYGERLRNQIVKIKTPEVVQGVYLLLHTNPNGIVDGDERDILAAGGIPFNSSSGDHMSIEEINIYFGLKFAYYMNEQTTTTVDKLINILLTYVYLILTSTERYSNNTRYQGRIISFYTVLVNFIKNLPL